MATARRELTFLLAGPERRLLQWIAARIPFGLRPNHFTALGVVAATGVGVAYALTNLSSSWLFAASALLVVQWFGDSLDGTLARVRHAERPRYGYYLDHIVDAYSVTVIGLGIGLSPYVSLGVALGAVVLYHLMAINVYLESMVFGAFKLAYGRLGPTEVRVILILANTGLALHNGGPWLPPVTVLANWGLALLTAGMLALLVARFAQNLAALRKMEPRPRPLEAARQA
jgi:phosphatidylglycerophosphate synthase